MRINRSSASLAISLVVLIAVVLPTIDAVAKPVGPNPGTSWPGVTVWGTGLSLENGVYAGAAWFGAGTSEIKIAAPPDPVDGVLVEFLEGGTKYATIVRLQVAAPQSYSYPVRMRSLGIAPSNATISSVMENADTSFVPQDFSVVLDNSTAGIFVNLREENGYITGLPKLATLYVDNAVNVTIAPNYQEGTVGENLTYTVTIQNTSRYNDNYSLSASDNLGWEISLDNDLLQIPAGENRTTTLHVVIENCASDMVTVTADGVYASDSDRTTATVPPRAVELIVEPGYQSAEPYNWLEYTVTVHNVGRLPDNYDLGVIDDLNWDNVYLDNTELENIRPCKSKQTILHVHVPYCVEGGTEDNITITATSQENAEVSDNDSCLAHVDIIRGVEISILPNYDNGVPCTTLDYTVTVKNTGNVDDTYDLSVSDNASWGDNIWLDDESLWVGRCGENKQTTLHVHVPYCVEGGSDDNITVTATSRADPAVSDNDSCLAHVDIVRGVEVSISPSYQGAPPTDTLYYTVVVKNNGNVYDNYDLSVSANAGWNPALPDNLLDVPFCENKQVVLSVVVPDNEPGTIDNVIVTVTSQNDDTVSVENYCTACVFAESILNLVAGWNLMGFPLTTESTTPNNVFTGLNYYTDYYLYYWNAPGGPYGIQDPDAALQDNLGYWVWINRDNTVRTLGIPPDNRDIYLENGWNLVSFPVVNGSTTPNNIFTGLNYYTDYYLYYWNAPGGPYRLQDPDGVLENNLGYWVWINRENMVTVP